MAIDKAAHYQLSVEVFGRTIASDVRSDFGDQAIFEANIDKLMRFMSETRALKNEIEAHPRGAKEAKDPR
jgi:hypothetical protein